MRIITDVISTLTAHQTPQYRQYYFRMNPYHTEDNGLSTRIYYLAKTFLFTRVLMLATRRLWCSMVRFILTFRRRVHMSHADNTVLANCCHS